MKHPRRRVLVRPLLAPAALALVASVGSLTPGCRPNGGVAPGSMTSASPAPQATGIQPSASASSAAAAAAPQRPVDPARAPFVAWLRARLPKGGEVEAEGSDPVRIAHTVQPGDTYASIADAYLELTGIYLARDLEKALREQNHAGDEPQPGARVAIPSPIQEPFKSADDERLGWPDDKNLRGLYVRGIAAGGPLYIPMLEKAAARGMNLIVLDARDYDGLITYPSKVPLANEVGATQHAHIRDLARAIRFAHGYGIRVAVRIACFEDELLSKARGDMSVQAVWGRPYHIGWLDPKNPDAQQYVIDLATEAMDAGADEIQLDYVRYPVLGIKGADFGLDKLKLKKTRVIRDFVRRVHALTEARKVALSLDIFGIVTEGDPADINSLGQDPLMLAKEAEALCPMVYPSHYHSGYAGFEDPGSHPEVVGIATAKLVRRLKAAHIKHAAVIRPWVQAVDHKSADYGPEYIAHEVHSAVAAGGVGWLLWNPTQAYYVTWRALPPVKHASIAREDEPKRRAPLHKPAGGTETGSTADIVHKHATGESSVNGTNRSPERAARDASERPRGASSGASPRGAHRGVDAAKTSPPARTRATHVGDRDL